MTAVPVAIYAPRAITHEQALILADCAQDFGAFLPYWHYRREDGSVATFARLWRGQSVLFEAMQQHSNIFALKAGKLGFTELECAFDAWVALFRQRNARVHLFSMGQQSSRDLLERIRFGLDHLPAWMRIPPRRMEAAADTSTSLRLNAGPGDTRTIVSYPSGTNVSIDQTATHAHLDEFCRWPAGEGAWKSVRSTISPAGTCHIISRGAGPGWSARVYRNARAGELFGQDGDPFRAVFAPWNMRPRPEGWRDRQIGKEGEDGYIFQYAPETWQQALQGDESYVYPMFEDPPGRHVTPAHPCPFADCVKKVITIDPGGTDPTALGLYGERSSGRAHKYDEWYKAGGASDDEIEAVIVEWEKLGGVRFDLRDGRLLHVKGERIRVGVPKDEPTLYHTLKAHGFRVFWCSTDRDEGIRLVRQRLATNGYTVHAGCKETILEYEDYRVVRVTDATTKVVYAGDRPVKHHADCVDCDRYAIMALGQWVEYETTTTPTGRTMRRSVRR